ncbi:MAG: serine/threonine protein kinase, partial [Tepidisphaeraceae bacterium]
MSDLDPTISDAPRLDQEAPALQQIGPYRILELLGSGGFGEVYKAERRVPMRQTVAIKVIKLGFDTKEIIARFNSERQALARMDHPNVAKVLDAGTTDTGRPYFVMEYVPGEPITLFCDAKKLSIKDRLELFKQACEAINHAHTKAIIHRDIKAGNVLAYLHDSKPVVKVIDFGIAKALTGDKLTEQTFNTERGQVIGTYETMSPEQADGSPDIDTRTDVYSLGVLLYELLSGFKPFDSATLRQAAEQEIKRIIREVEPPRPSTRLSGMGEEATKIASARREDLSALSRRLHSELEWIPLKAIRKERDRGYASPLQLAEDINNYLEGKPLIAGPESKVYRTKKFLKRHSAGIATSVAMVFLLTAGIGFYIHNIRAEQRKTEAALKEAKEQTAIAE